MNEQALHKEQRFVDRTTGQRRAFGLDALRGFAILTMALSGYIPWHVLPAWMYHAQLPPPSNAFDPSIPGITWVDLVFPFFLFSMGAAMPFALSRRLKKGVSMRRLVFFTLERGVLLAAFAVYIQHIRPWNLSSSPDTLTWILTVVGFLILFPMFIRLPRSTPSWKKWGIKAAGWIAAIVLLSSLRYPGGKSFSLYRFDIIIMVLANTVVMGSLIWLLTRHRLLLRLGIMGVLVAFRLASTVEGSWTQQLWNFTPEVFGFKPDWLFKFEYHKYLLIVLPGTIAGDLLLSWMKHARETNHRETPRWATWRFVVLGLLTALFNVWLLVGLHSRWLVVTTIVSLVMCAFGWWLVAKPSTSTERLFRSLFLWGSYWLILGLFFEPFEGGIKKDHATFSYFFVTTGLGIFLMMSFMIISDVFKKSRWIRLLIDNGQNPMIAYAAIQNVIHPFLALTGLGMLLGNLMDTPWLGALKGVIMTLLLAVFVSILTRLRIFWRT